MIGDPAAGEIRVIKAQNVRSETAIG